MEEFQMNWDGISDLKVYMYDSNWFLSDYLLGSLQINLLSANFPSHEYTPIDQNFDNSNSKIRFELRMNLLPKGVESVAKKDHVDNKDGEFETKKIHRTFPANRDYDRKKESSKITNQNNNHGNRKKD